MFLKRRQIVVVCILVRQTVHWRSQDFVLRGPENRGAVFETPKASSGEGNGEGYPPPQPTRGSGGASYKLPQRGPGRTPKTDFGAF